PRAPFVLGLVLGRLAERYLGISIGAYGAGWLLQPTIVVMALILLGSVSLSVYKRLRPTGEAVKGNVEPD
ncbi:MAG: hypothetical protein OXN22_03035, partial [Deltaproteobacteria bacterium]|nr:hypothetical protein [Deltaproteobacteria bacterium]